MAEAKNLFDKAASNFTSARILLNYKTDDEEQFNIAGYHLQQAVELAIKYLLEQNGVEYPKTHDIDQLIRIAKDNNVDLFLSEYIEDHAEMFSAWESKSRYVIGYSIEANKANRALTEVDKYLTTVAKALQ